MKDILWASCPSVEIGEMEAAASRKLKSTSKMKSFMLELSCIS